MPLDPQVAAHYAAQKAVGDISGSFNIDDLRKSSDRTYNDQKKFPAVFAIQDTSVPCPWGKLPLRIYVPDDQGPYPVMIYYHGGGFIIHNIASHDSLCRELALSCGCIVVSVGYRLAPEHPFPASIEDSYAALQWVYDNAVSLNIDRTRIAVAGDSAGAIISAAISLLARDRNGPKISLQVLCYGSGEAFAEKETESMRSYGNGNYVISSDFLDYCTHAYIREGTDLNNPYLNPIRASNLSNLPKTFSINAEYDPLRDGGEAFAHALKRAGNDVILLRVPGVMHGFLLLWEKFDASKEVIRKIADVVKETFIESGRG